MEEGEFGLGKLSEERERGFSLVVKERWDFESRRSKGNVIVSSHCGERFCVRI